jgi:hypothetical protein
LLFDDYICLFYSHSFHQFLGLRPRDIVFLTDLVDEIIGIIPLAEVADNEICPFFVVHADCSLYSNIKVFALVIEKCIKAFADEFEGPSHIQQPLLK